jgi:polysaccharide export outer membrane protein
MKKTKVEFIKKGGKFMFITKKILIFFLIMLLILPSLHPQQTYMIKPLDEIEVSVLGQPELSKKFIVGLDGKIIFPLIGEVNVAGQTPSEVANILKEKLKVYLPITDITVNLSTSRYISIYIFGEVKNPGEYKFYEQPTLLKVIAASGGPTQNANLSKIEIIRPDKTKIKVNLQKDLNESNFTLCNGDTIFVKKKKWVELGLIQTISWLIWTWVSIYTMSKGL